MPPTHKSSPSTGAPHASKGHKPSTNTLGLAPNQRQVMANAAVNTEANGHNTSQWLALYFPALPLEVFRLQGPDDAQVQVVIDDKRISHINPAAENAGILPGCTLATAYSITSDLAYFDRNPEREQAHLLDLAHGLYRYSSMVSLEAPDCIVLEIQASRRLWGSADAISQHALNLCADMGHIAIARCAATPKAAIALARGQKERLFDVPLYALELLEQGFSQRNLERLSNMGVYTLGQLMQLPRAGLGKRFGQCLTQYLGRLQGELPDPRQSIRPTDHFYRQQHLLKPISNKDVLLRGPMAYLAKQLEHWLIVHQQGCSALCWNFAPFKGAATKLPVRSGQGRQRHQDLLKLSALQLENTELPAEVLSITLEMTLSQPWFGGNQDLFGSPASANAAANELVDELTARLGQDACIHLQTQAQHSPEQAWRGVQGLSPTRQNPSLEADPGSTDRRSAALLRGQRPLWLFHQPQPVPEQHLQLLQGPERLTRSSAHIPNSGLAGDYRDYYIARHIQGALCWVYQTSRGQQTKAELESPRPWYLHGYFA